MNTHAIMTLLTAHPHYQALSNHSLLLLLSHIDDENGLATDGACTYDECFFDAAVRKMQARAPTLGDLFHKRLKIYRLQHGPTTGHQNYFANIAGALAGDHFTIDVLAKTLEDFIRKLEDDGLGDAIQVSPEGLANLLAELALEHVSYSIYDPHSATGRLLSQIVKTQWSRDRYVSALGQTTSEAGLFYSLARTFLMDYGLNFEQVNALKYPPVIEGDLKTFELVVSDLTNSVDEWTPDDALKDPFGRYKFGIPARGKSSWAFLQHMLACMNPHNGLVMAVIDEGALLRTGKEADIRRSIIDSNLLDTVIYLPQKLYRSDPRRLVILTFKASRGDAPMALLDGSSLYSSGKSLNSLTPEAIQTLSGNFSGHLSDTNIVRLLSISELQANNYALNVGRYFPSSSVEWPVDLRSLAHARQYLHEELKDIGTQIDVLLSEFSD